MPDPERAWRAHALVGVADFRRLANRLAAGGIVVMFPEGDLSPDGGIGPLRPGLASLVRRGRARSVQPVAIAYDPLASPRRRAYVSIVPPIEPRPGRLTAGVTAALRAATPLTPGQLAAAALIRREDLGGLAKQAIGRARDEERPVEPALGRGARGRERALRRAREQAGRRGPGDPLVRRLAREFESARGG